MLYPESPKVTTQGVILEEGGYKKKEVQKMVVVAEWFKDPGSNPNQGNYLQESNLLLPCHSPQQVPISAACK